MLDLLDSFRRFVIDGHRNGGPIFRTIEKGFVIGVAFALFAGRSRHGIDAIQILAAMIMVPMLGVGNALLSAGVLAGFVFEILPYAGIRAPRHGFASSLIQWALAAAVPGYVLLTAH